MTRRMFHIFSELFPTFAEQAKVLKGGDNHTLIVQVPRVQIIINNGERVSVSKPQVLIFTYNSSTDWSLTTKK